MTVLEQNCFNRFKQITGITPIIAKQGFGGSKNMIQFVLKVEGEVRELVQQFYADPERQKRTLGTLPIKYLNSRFYIQDTEVISLEVERFDLIVDQSVLKV